MSACRSSALQRTMPEVIVGCGSNLDPGRHLRWAIAELKARFDPVQCSSVYRSRAFGFDGPDFLNLVVAFDVVSDADAVEEALSGLEDEAGRDARDRSGSRTLDLDLLLFGSRVDAARRLPRADILVYPFVLGPLAELRPRLIHPLTGVAILSAWESRAAQAGEIARLGSLEIA